VIASTLHAERLTNLTAQEQYAAVELFRGTINRHSFIAFRDDSLANHHSIHFNGTTWQRYIPIRQPRVVCIQERLPPGAAAVLINQDHVDTDLIHPIDSSEKRLFDLLDGRKTITEIMNGGAHSMGTNLQLDSTRNFFKRLWQYDHIVFDASKAVP
jgi:hypothetical protein